MAEITPDPSTTTADARLTIPEGLLLLALDEQTGEFPPGISLERLHRALIFGALLDLIAQRRLRLVAMDEPVFDLATLIRVSQMLANSVINGQYSIGKAEAMKMYCIADTTPTGWRYLDRFLKLFESLKPGERTHTLGGFATLYSRQREETNGLGSEPIRAAADLLADGTLEQMDAQSPIMKRRVTGYRLPATGIRDTGKDSLRLRLVEAVSTSANEIRSLPRERILLYLCLIRSVGFIDAVFGRDRRDSVDWRIVTMCRPEASPYTLYGYADRYTRYGTGRSDWFTLAASLSAASDDY